MLPFLKKRSSKNTYSGTTPKMARVLRFGTRKRSIIQTFQTSALSDTTPPKDFWLLLHLEDICRLNKTFLEFLT
jgi:hypothetical protein